MGRLRNRLSDKRFRKVSAAYNINGYKRIYLVHIRKTGGTSLNNMFLSLGDQDFASLYTELESTLGHRMLRSGKIFVGWEVGLINQGNYFYAFSHTPMHRLDLPDHTFTITCFRDPVRRVISHYNMLMNYAVNKISHPCMEVEGKWLGDSFDDFLDAIPREHLLNQLYMFSENFDIDEAVKRVGNLSHYFFTEEFSEGIEELNRKTGLELKPVHVHKSGYQAHIPEESIARLRNKLVVEYEFLDRLSKSDAWL